VIFTRGHRLRGTPRDLSFAGHGILERVRSTTFALLGGTALFGLVLVALLSQAGLQYLPPLPIPAAPSGEQAIGDASVAAPSGNSIAPNVSAARAPRALPGGTAGGAGPGGGSQGGSRVAGSHQVAAAPGSAANQPTGQGAPQPQPAGATPPAPLATVPSPAPAPAAGTPTIPVASSPPRASTAGGKGSSKSNGKAVGHTTSKSSAGSSSIAGTSTPPKAEAKAAKAEAKAAKAEAKAAKAEAKAAKVEAKAAKAAAKASSKPPPVATEQAASPPAADPSQGTGPGPGGGKGHSKH
jgi:hypothetical protein